MNEEISPSKLPKQLTPLWMFAIFIFLTQTVLGYEAIQTSGSIQLILVSFAVLFPIVVAVGFFAVLWIKPWVLYPPSEYTTASVQKYVEALRGNTGPTIKKTADIRKKIEVVGNPDRMQLLSKAQGSSWMKSTKAMQIPDGCIVQATTKQQNPDGSWSVAETLTLAPGVEILEESDGNGKYLAPIGKK